MIWISELGILKKLKFVLHNSGSSSTRSLSEDAGGRHLIIIISLFDDGHSLIFRFENFIICECFLMKYAIVG